MEFKYVLIMKFCAGSDDKTDIDEGIYLFTSKEKYSLKEMKEKFKTVNSLLGSFEDENEYPISYLENGLNLDTLIEGMRIHTKATIDKIDTFEGLINGIYVIEQWW